MVGPGDGYGALDSHSEKSGSGKSTPLFCPAVFASASRDATPGQYPVDPVEIGSSFGRPGGSGEGNGSGYATATG